MTLFSVFQFCKLSACKKRNIVVIAKPVYNIEKWNDNERKLAHNGFQRFKSEAWFTDNLVDDVTDFLKRYEDSCTDYNF